MQRAFLFIPTSYSLLIPNIYLYRTLLYKKLPGVTMQKLSVYYPLEEPNAENFNLLNHVWHYTIAPLSVQTLKLQTSYHDPTSS